MPLDKSGSKASVGKNITTEEKAGKPYKQALAIALSVQRRAGGKVSETTANVPEKNKKRSVPPSQVKRLADRGNKWASALVKRREA